MSSLFNINRTAKLVRWTFVTDKKSYHKYFVMLLVVMCIIYQENNILFLFGHTSNSHGAYGATIGLLIGGIIGSAGNFLYSYRYWKDGIRELYLLPASNLEKFTVRYVLNCLIISAVGCIISLLIADALQYIVAMIIGNPQQGWITGKVISLLNLGHLAGYKIFFIVALMAWLNSLFLLGANYFRSIKHSILFTAIILFTIFLISLMVLPTNSYEIGKTIGRFMKHWEYLLGAVLICFCILNFVLSYLLFSHRQIKGRFFNTI